VVEADDRQRSLDANAGSRKRSDENNGANKSVVPLMRTTVCPLGSSRDRSITSFSNDICVVFMINYFFSER
jgi:hypothetical protein